VALGVLALLLSAGLIYLHWTAVGQKNASLGLINNYSNQWVEASLKLNEQKLVNLTLERDYATTAEDLKGYSNQLAAVNADLENLRVQAKTVADVAGEHLREQDSRIETLQQEREGMNRNIGELSDAIANLESQIAETERKLAASTTEKAELLAELSRLKSEKEDLEKRFNNLAMVREQMRRLRDELSLSRRLEWLRQGLTGGPKHKSFATLASAATLNPNFGLDVQLRSDGRNSSTAVSAK
jgi:chromosome segregation ATPase